MIAIKPDREEEAFVGFQQTITNIITAFPLCKKIIGVTLTTEAIVDNQQKNKQNANADLITDISVVCRDTIIIIEVKRFAVDARNQLNHQVDSYIESAKESDSQYSAIKYNIDLKWEEVISILQDVNIISRGSDNILIHYLKHLENRYQEWFSVKKFSDIDPDRDNEGLINKRIIRVIDNCCANEEEARQFSNRYIIPLDCGWASEVQIDMDYIKKSLKVIIWLGDTKTQGWVLLNKTNNDFSWVYNNILNVDNKKYNMEVNPYLRLAHFHSGKQYSYFDGNYYGVKFGKDKNKWYKLFDDISGWQRSDWDKLKGKFIKDYKGIIDYTEFVKEFKFNFENSNRSYVHVSFGFEITTYIPYKDIQVIDKSSKTEKGKDKVAELVRNVIDEYLKMIG